MREPQRSERVRRTVEPASGRAVRRCAAGADPTAERRRRYLPALTATSRFFLGSEAMRAASPKSVSAFWICGSPEAKARSAGLRAEAGVDDLDLDREVDEAAVGVLGVGLLELLGRRVLRGLLDELEELVADLRRDREVSVTLGWRESQSTAKLKKA